MATATRGGTSTEAGQATMQDDGLTRQRGTSSEVDVLRATTNRAVRRRKDAQDQHHWAALMRAC